VSRSSSMTSSACRTPGRLQATRCQQSKSSTVAALLERVPTSLASYHFFQDCSA
jgi:hypothetical protein